MSGVALACRRDTESYLRYLVHGMREDFDLPGTPIRVTLRENDNPYAGRKSKQR